MSETNWYVITGAPSSGKTTLLKELEKIGYRVVHEVARAHIETQMARGRTLEEIRSDKQSFENRVLNRKIALEAQLPKHEVIVFDRAVPDSIAYFELAGLDTAETIAKSPRNRYRKVFLLNPLPYVADHARIEDQQTAARLDQSLGQSYRKLGYDVIRIDAMPVEDRLVIILKEMEKDGRYKEEVFDDGKEGRSGCHRGKPV